MPPTPDDVRVELEELAEVDRRGRISRTVQQAAPTAAALVVLSWLARLAGLDLDPGPGVDLPADVAVALGALGTAVTAWRMNRRAPVPPAPAP